MCDPITLGLLMGGTALQTYAGNRTQAAAMQGVNRATEAEMGRQKGYQAEEQATMGEVMESAGFDPMEAARTQAQADRETTARENTADVLTERGQYSGGASGRGGALDRVVQGEQERARGAVEQGITSAASLSSLGDALGGINRDRQPLLHDMNALKLFAGRSANLLPGELEGAIRRAGTKYAPHQMLGSLLSAGGAAKAMQVPAAPSAAAAPAGATSLVPEGTAIAGAATPSMSPWYMGNGLYSLVPSTDPRFARRQ